MVGMTALQAKGRGLDCLLFQYFRCDFKLTSLNNIFCQKLVLGLGYIKFVRLNLYVCGILFLHF